MDIAQTFMGLTGGFIPSISSIIRLIDEIYGDKASVWDQISEKVTATAALWVNTQLHLIG
jgi:hypothetical protein